MNRRTSNRLRIAFADFEHGFDQEDNWLFRLLEKQYEVSISEDPEFLFFSNYGHRYLEYSCPRIFVSCENVRTFGWKADFIFESDYRDKDLFRFRMPYYRMRYTQEKLETYRDWKSLSCETREFACVVISNPMGKERNEFWDCLSTRGQVASGGHYRNNVGGPVPDKIQFCRKFKFCIAFENSGAVGYLTEKVVDAWMAGCVPIYWGDEKVGMDINPRAFIHARDFNSWESLADHVQAVDRDPDLYLGYLREPLLHGGILREELTDASILQALGQAFSRRHRIPPTFKRVQKSLKGALEVRKRIKRILRKDWYK